MVLVLVLWFWIFLPQLSSRVDYSSAIAPWWTQRATEVGVEAQLESYNRLPWEGLVLLWLVIDVSGRAYQALFSHALWITVVILRSAEVCWCRKALQFPQFHRHGLSYIDQFPLKSRTFLINRLIVCLFFVKSILATFNIDKLLLY